MGCETCDYLLAAFQHSINLYKQATQEMAGLGGEELMEFLLALEAVERFRANCQDANEMKL